MKQTTRKLYIQKDALKFSSAHMTVFPDGTKESLHGHNYTATLTVTLRSMSLRQMIPYSIFKSKMAQICQEWDEKLLLPGKCPFFKTIRKSKVEIEFKLCKKRYLLPQDETVILPVDNITAEALAETFCNRLLEKVDSKVLANQLQAVEVKIEEFPGQGASFQWNSPEIE